VLIYRGFCASFQTAFRGLRVRNAFTSDTGVHTAADSGFNFIVKRNCSISPRDLFGVLGVAILVSFCIAGGFAYFGAWMILPFAGLEMVALAAAFYLNGRHAADYEHIALTQGRLVVVQRSAERLIRREFNPEWVRLAETRLGTHLRLRLRSHGKALEIGRDLSSDQRVSLAERLRYCMANYPLIRESTRTQ
jgi:uncharacterized membrane protein